MLTALSPTSFCLLGLEMFWGETNTAKPAKSVNTVLNSLLIIHQSGLSLQLPFMFICQLLLRPFITLNPSTWRSHFYRPLMSLHFAFGVMSARRYSEGKRAFGFLGKSHAIMTITSQMKIHMTFSYKIRSLSVRYRCGLSCILI